MKHEEVKYEDPKKIIERVIKNENENWGTKKSKLLGKNETWQEKKNNLLRKKIL